MVCRKRYSILLVAAMCLLSGRSFAQDEPDALGGAIAAPLKAAWEFSQDGGKSFSAERPLEVDSSKVKLFVARATFTIEDPAAIAGLWLGHDDTGPFLQRGAFCLAGKEDAGLKEGRTCGATPLWTYTKVTLNGQEPGGPLAAMLYRPMPLEPGKLLTKGKNTLLVSGALWCLSSPVKVPTRPLLLLAAAPQPALIRSGPVLAEMGPEHFTVTCRTSIPASVSVAVTPVTGAPQVAVVTSELGLYHRLKVPLSKGARRYKYFVTSKAGSFTTTKGPYEVQLPEEASLRFVALGNTRCNKYSDENAPLLAAGMLKTQPHLFVHAGQVMELPTWDYHWDPHFFAKYGSLLATVPTYLTPGPRDDVGLTQATFSMPAARHWTTVQANVRFIGLDGAQDWATGSANAKWLEGVLREAKEPFVFAFDHYPGYSSGQASRPLSNGKLPRPLQQCREVILPLLAKYRATALVSAFDYNYERCEAAGDKGVTCVIVGGGGAKTLREGGRAANNNPFTGTGPFVAEHAFAVFEVRGDRCEMRALNVQGKEIDRKLFKAR